MSRDTFIGYARTMFPRKIPAGENIARDTRVRMDPRGKKLDWSSAGREKEGENNSAAPFLKIRNANFEN